MMMPTCQFPKERSSKATNQPISKNPLSSPNDYFRPSPPPSFLLILESSRMDCEDDKVGNESHLIKQGVEAGFRVYICGKKIHRKRTIVEEIQTPILGSKLTLKRLNAVYDKGKKAWGLYSSPLCRGPLLHTLTLEYIEGVSVKDVFLEFGANGIVEECLDDVAAQIGDAIAKLHDGGLAHGDLTTSNMLVRSGTNQLVCVFRESDILTAYRKSSKQWSATHKKLAQVRQRGRKRTMIG